MGPTRAQSVEIVARIQVTAREAFVAEHPGYFLVGGAPPAEPGWRQAASIERDLPPRSASRTPTAEVARSGGLSVPLVLPLKKTVADERPHITVGRAVENDVVVRDPQVSNVHAYFKVAEDHILVCDAGSTNGTWLDGERLPASGPARMVIPGDLVGFGQLDFAVLDAAACWERLRMRAE